MKSFSLLTTNVGLTTNIKIMVTSNYKLSLDSIESDTSLSYDRFKKVSFNKENYYDELIPYFYKDVSPDIAFKIKYDNDNDSMSNDFKDQYDDIYQCGARNISNNKNYKEEYEYFAPLYLIKGKIPKNFIIFRVDGAGITNLNKENFNSNIIKKMKTVKVFDLTKETELGEWMSKNFIENKFFPDSVLDIDFRTSEFSRWNGIDYLNGGYTYKSLFIDDIIDEEKEIFEFEKFVFDSYKNNKVVFPSILNLSFLFDDEPSTPESKRKWSINRYYGFYLDNLELVKTISPYNPIPLKEDIVIIDGNIIQSISDNPFIQDWSDKKPFYIEYNDNYYRVERFTETITSQTIKREIDVNTKSKDIGFRSSKGKSNDIVKKSITTNTKFGIEEIGELKIDKYRIISDIKLSGLTHSAFNNNFGEIEYSTNRLVNGENTAISIPGFNHNDTNLGVWVIEIDGIYHNIISQDNEFILNTDYSFIFNQNDFTYKVGGISKKIETYVDFDKSPKKFSIFRLNLTDIKDFDNRIVDTDYSKYEYELENDLTITDETKMYLENIESLSDPIELDDFIYKNNVVNIPTSSEYTANYETFKIDTELSSIWRKNPVYCRWGFNKSLSANDLPYLLNNSLIFEDHNRSTNIYESFPKRIERNLDYFYTINSNSELYTNHSLHIEKKVNGYIDTTFKFDLDEYLTSNYDYFTNFFKRKMEFNNYVTNVTKFSYFNVGDESIPNHTIFRGIRFNIFEVNNISLDINKKIDKINAKPSNKFNDYKLSILLTDNKSVDNVLQWKIIKEWRMDKVYDINDLVIFDDILYKKESVTNNSNNISQKPFDQGFILYNIDTIFWNGRADSTQPFIYYHGEYYELSSGSIDFWSINNSYDLDEIVLYKNKYYKSKIQDNSYIVDDKNWIEYETTNEPKWKIIEEWNINRQYTTEYVIYQNILYKSIELNSNRIPNSSKNWVRKYSILPDTNIGYNDFNNPIIKMNNAYYLSINSNLLLDINGNASKLDNGITIYINEKWKNILINIYVSDNTYINLSETNRDSLYDELYSKLTASNFINSLNDITNKYDFSNYIKYSITDIDLNTTNYSSDFNNLNFLPYLIVCEEPEILNVKVNSLFKRPVEKPVKLTFNNNLNNGKIVNINQLNHYNNISIASNIIENKYPARIYENYHGNQNIVNNEIYRYSGYYSPIFYDIQLFESKSDLSNEGNYKFDISLTDFGIVKERKVRKVNRRGDILKLSNQNDEKSMYPMLDEFGYSICDFFIFSSTWDDNYYLETINLNKVERILDDNIINIPNDIGQRQN